MTDTTPRTEDWLDRLYADEQPTKTVGGGRLPDWRTPPQPLPPTEPPAAPTDEPPPAVAPATDWWAGQRCAHEAPVPVYAQPTGELVAYLCPTCDEQLPAEEEPVRAPWLQPQPGYYPPLPTPTVPVDKARAALRPRTRAGLYNVTAAGAGWLLGLEPALGRAIADCGTTTSIGGALTLGIGGCLVIAHFWDRHTRHWWIGLAWVARIPLASALTALALYAPASQF